MKTDDLMRRIHLIVGIATIVAFLATGAYLNLVAHPRQLPPGPQLMYVSRHIYLLAPGLVHLVLSVYVRVVPHPRVPRLQWAGSAFLVVSSVCLVAAFVIEPIAGRGRTPVSALGIFSLWAGTILHVIAPRLGRSREG